MTTTQLKIRINKLRALFLRKGIKVKDEWLEGCVDYFLEDNPNMTDEALHTEAYSQWLLVDLKEAGVACLPQSVNNNPAAHEINGKFAVQIQQLLDISSSPYDQLRKMYGEKLDEVIEETQPKTQYVNQKKNRCIRLTLTDGVTEVKAMEFQPIPQLSIELPPGTKLVIVGPVRCVKNVLFLQAKHVQVLGGEVEELIVEFAYENVLRKMLNKPINPNPRLKFDGENTAPGNLTTQIHSTASTGTMRTPATATLNGNNNQMPPPPTRPVQSRSVTSSSNLNQQTQDLFDDDDDILLNVDIESIERSAGETRETNSVVQSSITSYVSRVTPVSNQTNLKPKIQQVTVAPPPRATSNQQPGPSRINEPPSKKFITALDDDDDFDFEALRNLSEELSKSATETTAVNSTTNPTSVQQHVEEVIPIDSNQYKYKIEGLNVITIKQLIEIPLERRKNKQFIFFPSGYSPIRRLHVIKVNDEYEWTFGTDIEDGTSDKLVVDYCPKLLDSIIGYTAAEMNQMKVQVKTNPGIKDKIQNDLKNLSVVLNERNKLWKISFVKETPLVIGMVDIKPVYKKILHKKCDAEQLEYIRQRIPD